jgi:hypothetical protein
MPISEATRRRIFRIFREDEISWSGRLEAIDFLKRLYDLDQFPSTDNRFETAQGDIWQHTVNNDDWDKYWIFEAEGERFNLLDGPEMNSWLSLRNHSSQSSSGFKRGPKPPQPLQRGTKTRRVSDS